jgi:hypothetical protein
MINAFLTETRLGKALRQKSGDGIEMIIPKQNDRMSPKASTGTRLAQPRVGSNSQLARS